MLKIFRKTFAICIVLCIPALFQFNFCSAQIYYCQDTTLINPYYPCLIEYNPVCACNGKTYRNFCFAELKDGIIPGRYVEGVCGDFEIDIVPNPPVQNNNVLELGIFVHEPSNVEIFVTDSYGVNVYRNTFRNYQFYPNNPVYIDTINFEEGVYIVVVIVNNRFRSEKFTVIK